MTALALTFFWPILATGPGSAGIGLVVTGLLTVFLLPRRYVRGLSLRPDVVFPMFAAFIWSVVVSFPLSGENEITGLLVFATQSLPLFAFFATARSVRSSFVVYLGLPLAIWVLATEAIGGFPSIPSGVNTIAQGHAIWIAGLIGFTNDTFSPAKRFLVGTVCLVALLLSPSSGPALAGVVALVFFYWQGVRNSLRAKAFSALVVTAIAVLTIRSVVIEFSETATAINNSLARLDVWSAVLREHSFLGNGVSEIFLPTVGRSLGNAHNFWLDFLWVGGYLGLALVLLGTVRSIQGARWKSRELRALQVGLLTAALFSGSIFSVFTWLAIGIGATSYLPPQSRKATHQLSSVFADR